MAEAIADLLDYAGELGTGPPFAVRTAELEVGLPVAPGVLGRGRIEVRRDDGFRALATLYHGAYERLAGVSRGLWEALRRQGVEPAGGPREVYLNKDKVDRARLASRRSAVLAAVAGALYRAGRAMR